MPIRNDKIFFNNIPSDWAISIGSTNVTALVTRLEISKPIPSQRSPQLISGTIELVQPINIALGRRSGVYAPALASYSIDPSQNSDLRAYAQPVTIFGEGRTISILRFTEDVFFDFNTGVATGTLGHRLLSVVEQENISVDIETGSVSNIYDVRQNLSVPILPIGVYAQRLLAGSKDGSGASPFTESDLDVSALPTQLANTVTGNGIPQTLGYEEDQNFDGDLDVVLHGIFLENASRALEPIPGTERLRASDPYPLSKGSRSPRLALPWSQTIITPEDTSIEAEITAVEVSSGGGGITRRFRRISDEYPYEVVTASFADGSPAETTLIDQPTDSNDRLVTTYRRRTAINWLIGGSNSNIITRTETKTETFGNQGEPTRREQEFTITRHELGKLPVPGLGRYQQEEKDVGVTDLTSGLKITTEWSYDSSGNLTSIATTHQIGAQYAFPDASGDGLVTVLREEEVYQNTLNSTINPKWETFTTRMIAQGLIDETQATTLVADPDFYSEHRPIDGVPRPQYREPKKPITIQRFAKSRSEININGAGSPSTLTAQATYAASDEGGAQLAQTLLAMNAQLREVWDVRMPMPSGFDLFGSWDIFYIDNGREARAIALVGPFLIYENGQTQTLTYGGTAAQLGTLTYRIRPISKPVSPLLYVAPTPAVPDPVIPLSINPVGDAAIVQGIELIPIKLEAYGGTPPYTYSAVGLPAGLSVVGNEIAGAPSTETAAISITASVEDATTATASTDFLIEVIAAVEPSPSYPFVNPAYVFSKSVAEISAVELPFVVAVGGVTASGNSELQAFSAEASGGVLAGGSGEGKGAIAVASGGMLAGGENLLQPVVAEASGGALFGGNSVAESPRLIAAAAAAAAALGITQQEVLDELNLLWWFDFSETTNLTKVGGGIISNGDEIETMSSSTTTANTFTFNAGARATKTAEGIQLNGGRYQGSATKDSSNTFFLIGKTTTKTGDQRIFAPVNPAFEPPDSVSQFVLFRIDNRNPEITLNSAVGTTLPDGTLTGSQLDQNDHIFTFDINTTSYAIRVDGAEDARFDGIDTTTEFVAPVTVSTSGLFAGGRTPGATTNAVEGEYKGVLFGPVDSDIAIIERFLSEYYNIAIA